MWTRRRRLALLLAAAALLLLVGGRMAAEFVVGLFWYRSLGLERVFWTQWSAGLGVRAAVALPIGLFVFGNLWHVTRSLGAIRVRRRYGNIEIAERLSQSYVTGALLLIAGFSGWWLSAGMTDPLSVLVSLRPAAWGMHDPVFGHDLSFYLFRLPVLDRLQTLAGVLLFWVALLVGGAYLATGAVRAVDTRLTVTPAARRHLGLLLAAFLLVLAWDVWLDRYGVLFSGSGVGGAPGFTDLHARLPGRLLTCIALLGTAGAVAYGAWYGRRRAPLLAAGALLVVALGGLVVYPALVQKLVVEPDEFARERPYLERHLAFTREAFGLERLRVQPLPYRDSLEVTPERLTSALSHLPLWDPRPLLTTVREQQNRFPYYEIAAVEADRYGPASSPQQVAVAVRELKLSGLSATARTWQNQHLRYVSGEGAVVAPMARADEDGTPVYFLHDLPPRLAPDAPRELELREPEIYFGERPTDAPADYVILDSAGGPRGVELNSLWKKLVFAWAFQSKNLLLSGQLTPESRIVYRRQVVERVHAVAPFLDFAGEQSAYPVVHDGRIVWMLDGYTASSWFPLAPSRAMEGLAPVRYVRNSVKATVDAWTGEVRLYSVDARDPVLRAYSRLFPGLVRALAEMPAELRRHLRFPAPLLALQAELLSEYHLRDPRAFYAKEDVWAVANQTYRAETEVMRPLYVTQRLPGSEHPEFLLSLPFVSSGRQNMTALFVARNDPPHYGEQLLYTLPRDVLVPGPQQMESLIEQDPEISQQLSLWKQGGSDVIRGTLTVVPLDSTLVYVEPVFLEADNAAIPQLARVIVGQGGRVAMRPTLPGAVAALLAPAPGSAAGNAPPPASAPAAGSLAGGAADVLAQARRLFARAEEELRGGDWAAFGRTWSALGELLGRGGPPEPRRP